MTRARTPRPHEIDQARRDERLLRAFRERDRDPAWRTRGACQAVDPETFFPAPSESADPAMSLCRTCPVQGPCLAWALEAGDLHGVWGATTVRERRAMAVVWRSGELERHGSSPGAGEPAGGVAARPGDREPARTARAGGAAVPRPRAGEPAAPPRHELQPLVHAR